MAKVSNGVKENPYLAHLTPKNRYTPSSSPGSAVKEPLLGFLPRKVNGEQVRKALVSAMSIMCVLLFISFQDGDVNPFTKDPLSPAYKKILEARRKLPVFAQMDEFYKMVSTWVEKASFLRRS